MKKKIIIISVVILIVIISTIATILIINKNKEKSMIEESMHIAELINNNSKLPVKYMSKYNKDDSFLKKYEEVDNYMSNDYYGDDIFFSYFGYPNDESDFYLGEIKLITDKYNLLGVSVGDNCDKVISKIEEYGFSLKEEDSVEIKLTQGDYTITIEKYFENNENTEEEAVITSIKISVDSKYLGNRIY